ncbi:hypothetical protein QVD17_39146 [Tagetes erecta]|uniref:Serpin domain-containing protein n=1 Tax=Tagetes erecta TaxID=13708 RepID=A0AAD8JTH2_TARER|nr:hypothetical protein QVD17_39146 [Tagetes erecta]
MAPFFRHCIFNNHKPRRRHSNTKFRRKHPRPKAPMDLEESIKNQTHVATTLATHLLSNIFPNSNVVFSPLSIHLVLSLLAAGCKGPTLDQLLGFLKANNVGDLNSLYSQFLSLIFADGSPNGGPLLAAANGVWVQKTLSLKPSFKQVVDTVYKAACNQVDFKNKAVEVAKEVNLWAEKQTNGLIKEVLPTKSVNYLTRFIFGNALYFKGVWRKMFNSSFTREHDFHLLDGNKVRVPFMTGGEYHFMCAYDDFKVLGLPYLQGQDKRQFTMYFFLPHAKNGLQSLVEKIGSTPDFLEGHIPRQLVKVDQLLIPKFKILFEIEASGMLKELGLKLPFDDDVDDFTEMFDLHEGEPLNVSAIHHKSFVEVNEEGTEATMATILNMSVYGAMTYVKREYVKFVADHPFLFVIREDVTGVVLFMGQVIDPSVVESNT